MKKEEEGIICEDLGQFIRLKNVDNYFNSRDIINFEHHKKLEMNRNCYFCDKEKKIHLHHIIRKKDGGLDELNNLIPLCQEHHQIIHSRKHILQFSNGFWFITEISTLKVMEKPSQRQQILCRGFPYMSLEIAKKTKHLTISENSGKTEIKTETIRGNLL